MPALNVVQQIPMLPNEKCRIHFTEDHKFVEEVLCSLYYYYSQQNVSKPNKWCIYKYYCR